MVYEARGTDVRRSASTWRIEITRDRMLVSPCASVPGLIRSGSEGLGVRIELGEAIGRASRGSSPCPSKWRSTV
jgi:hypothetical protein